MSTSNTIYNPSQDSSGLVARLQQLENRNRFLESRYSEQEGRNSELKARNSELEARNSELETGNLFFNPINDFLNITLKYNIKYFKEKVKIITCLNYSILALIQLHNMASEYLNHLTVMTKHT